MYRKLVFIIFLVSSFSVLSQFSDNNSVLIYSDGQGFLQPYIESTIKNLKKVSDDEYNYVSDTKYFKEVNSLNTYISDNKYQAVLTDLLDTQAVSGAKVNLYYNEDERAVRQRIFNILTEYDYFLVIKTNTLGELIEFQFQLYQTINNLDAADSRNVPINISDRTIGTENFFINPKEPDYRKEISNAIHRLFPNSNKKPIAELKIFDETVKSGDTIKVTLNSKISFNGTNSGDYDSPNISYIWRNIPAFYETIQTANNIGFDEGKPIQEVEINSHGFYNIGFKVFDGIQFSDEIIVKLETVLKPDLIVPNTFVTSFAYFNLFSGLSDNSSDKVYEEKLRILQTTKEEYENKSFLLSNEKIGSKYIAARHYYVIDTTAHIVTGDGFYDNLVIKTKIRDFDENCERKMFLYSLSKYRLLSDETQIVHTLKERPAANFYLKFGGAALLLPKNEDGSESDEKFSSFTTTFGFGVFLSKNIEPELAFGFINSSIEVNNTVFRYPSFFDVSLKYHIYSSHFAITNLESFYVGVLYRNYLGPKENEENKILHRGLGAKVGSQIRILDEYYLKLDFFGEVSATKFINSDNDYLDRVYDLGLSLGLAISL